MNDLVAGCQKDYGRNVQQEVARLEWAHFDGEPAAEPKNHDGKNGPPIEEDEIEFGGTDEAKAAISLTERRRVRDRGEDERDNSPRREVKERRAPFRCASFDWQVIRQLHGLGKRAGEGNRTLVSSLGSWRSTIELHPRRIFDCRFSIADLQATKIIARKSRRQNS